MQLQAKLRSQMGEEGIQKPRKTYSMHPGYCQRKENKGWVLTDITLCHFSPRIDQSGIVKGDLALVHDAHDGLFGVAIKPRAGVAVATGPNVMRK